MRLIVEREGKRIYESYYSIDPAEEAQAVAEKAGPGIYSWWADKCICEYRDEESEVYNVVLVDCGTIEIADRERKEAR